MKGIGRVPWREACTELRQSRVETFLKWFCFMTVLSGVFTPLQGAVFCRTQENMCSNPGYIKACKAAPSGLLVCSIIAHFYYEDLRLTQLRERDGSSRVAWIHFTGWMGFDAVVLGGWIHMLFSWPSTQWPPFLYIFLVSLIWTVALSLDISETKRAVAEVKRVGRARRMGSAAASFRAIATSTSPPAPTTSDPTTSGVTSGSIASEFATSGPALELDDLDHHGRAVETHGSAEGMDGMV